MQPLSRSRHQSIASTAFLSACGLGHIPGPSVYEDKGVTVSAHGQGSPQPPQRSTWTLTPLGCPVHGLGPQWRPRGHAPSVQWGSPAGAPLYPRLRIRLLRVTITAPTWLRVHAALVDAVFARSRKYSRHVGLLKNLHPYNNRHNRGPRDNPSPLRIRTSYDALSNRGQDVRFRVDTVVQCKDRTDPSEY